MKEESATKPATAGAERSMPLLYADDLIETRDHLIHFLRAGLSEFGP